MSVSTNPIAAFSVAVTGQTVVPIGTIFINDNRPRTPSGSLTFNGTDPAGTLYDVYAQGTTSNTYALVALFSGSAPPTNSILVGNAKNYPLLSSCQWLPLRGGSPDFYMYVDENGMHIRPFGGVGYSQVFVESPGHVNDLTIQAIPSQVQLFTSPGSGGGVTVQADGQLVLQGKSVAMNGTSGTAGPVYITTAGGDIGIIQNGPHDIQLNCYGGGITIQTQQIGNPNHIILQTQAGAVVVNGTATSGNGEKLSVNGIFWAATVKGTSKPFEIPHPLKPDTHHLIHVAVEAPRHDLIYRGRVTLDETGRAEIDIDASCGMSRGTFAALCREDEADVLCTARKETVDWTDPVDGRFSIFGHPSAKVTWLVVAERCDDALKGDTLDHTDADGRLILEPMAGSE